ncbi:MAG: winged helix-turn-helix domain-containing protein, partial [Acidobacteriota bacterium]
MARRSEFQLGPWSVEPATGRLRDGSTRRQLTPRAMKVLLALVDRAGDVVSRDELHRQVWNDRVVGEDVQRRAIAELRRELGDDASSPTYIETLPRRGYRLIAPVGSTVAPTDPPDTSVSSHREVMSGPRRPWVWATVGLMLVVVVAGSRLDSADRWDSRVPFGSAQLETRPLTAMAGRESQPALSPDGRRLVFRLEVEGERVDLWIQDLEVDAPARFTDDEAWEGAAAFTPDGVHLAYSRGLATPSGPRYEVVLRPLLGTGTKTLAVFEGPVFDLDVSPQGDRLVVSTRPSGQPAHLALLSFDGEIQRLTTPPRTSFGDMAPAFSPTGDAVAFVRGVIDNAHDIYRVSLEDGSEQRLTHLDGKIPGLAWSDRGLFFTRFPPGHRSLWRLDPETGALEATTLPARFPTQLAAAGDRLVLLDSGNDADIVSLPLQGSAGDTTGSNSTPGGTRPAAAIEVVRSTAWDAAPTYSIARRRLAFVSTRSGSAEIWTSDPDGTSPRRLTRLEGPLAQHPRFSPDGSQLAYDVRIGDRSEIHLVELDGGVAHTLGPGDAHELLPTFSLDGRRIYFLSDRGGAWGLWTRRLPSPGATSSGEVGPTSGDGEATKLLEGRYLVAEDPVDGTLVVSRKDAPGLWRLQPSGELQSWRSAPVPYRWSLWALDAERLLTIVQRG